MEIKQEFPPQSAESESTDSTTSRTARTGTKGSETVEEKVSSTSVLAVAASGVGASGKLKIQGPLEITTTSIKKEDQSSNPRNQNNFTNTPTNGIKRGLFVERISPEQIESTLSRLVIPPPLPELKPIFTVEKPEESSACFKYPAPFLPIKPRRRTGKLIEKPEVKPEVGESSGKSPIEKPRQKRSPRSRTVAAIVTEASVSSTSAVSCKDKDSKSRRHKSHSKQAEEGGLQHPFIIPKLRVGSPLSERFKAAGSESQVQNTSSKSKSQERNKDSSKVIIVKEERPLVSGNEKMNFSSTMQISLEANGGGGGPENMDVEEFPPVPALPARLVNVNNGIGHELMVPMVEGPAAPRLLCGGGSLDCKEVVSAAIPCLRCHREFYCSAEHRHQNVESHKLNCKTPSCLEVIFSDEQYSMWYKKAASNLYDICLNFVLVWPSLTVQWLPHMTELENNVKRYQLLVGTQTNGETNHLMICGIDIPDRVVTNISDVAETRAIHNGSLYVMKRINHEGEIHRARYMPQHSNIVATKSPSSEVFIFDCAKFPEIPEDNLFKPCLRLRGHSQEGFGMAWNNQFAGRLLSGSSDHLVCLWDINGTSSVDNNLNNGIIGVTNGSSYLDALMVMDKHTDVVEDVAWHHENNNICASVGDDRKLILWDIRLDGRKDCINSNDNAHDGDINAVGFSSFNDYLLATASSDKIVGIWDMRYLGSKLLKLEFHKDDVMQVVWSPHDSKTLASTGKDRRVFIWNLNGIQTENKTLPEANGNGQPDPDVEAEPPSTLQFIHGGHVTGVNDIAWNFHDAGVLASVSEDNILQVWKMDDNLRITEPSEEDDREPPEQPGMSSQSEVEEI